MSQSKMELRLELSEDRLTAKLVMMMDGADLGHMFLDAGDLSGLIANLAKARADMADMVPLNLDPHARLEAVVDPSWQLAPDSGGLRNLALRHPGLGWLAFRMNMESSQRLGSGLSRKTIP